MVFAFHYRREPSILRGVFTKTVCSLITVLIGSYVPIIHKHRRAGRSLQSSLLHIKDGLKVPGYICRSFSDAHNFRMERKRLRKTPDFLVFVPS